MFTFDWTNQPARARENQIGKPLKLLIDWRHRLEAAGCCENQIVEPNSYRAISEQFDRKTKVFFSTSDCRVFMECVINRLIIQLPNQHRKLRISPASCTLFPSPDLDHHSRRMLRICRPQWRGKRHRLDSLFGSLSGLARCGCAFRGVCKNATEVRLHGASPPC